MFSDAGTVLVGIGAIVTALGTAAAAVITATHQGARTRRHAGELHQAASTDRDVKTRELADKADRNHEAVVGYMTGVNATLAAMADLSKLAIPFMQDYQDRHPEAFGQ